MSQKPRFPSMPRKPVALPSGSRASTATSSSSSTSTARIARPAVTKKPKEKRIAYQIADPTNVIETEILRRDLYNDILSWANSQIGRYVRQDKEVQNLLLRYILNKIITRTTEDDPVFIKTRSKIAETQLKKDFRRLRIQVDANKFIQELEARIAAASNEVENTLITPDQIPYVEKCYIVYPGLTEEIRAYDVNFCARSSTSGRSSRRQIERNDRLSYLVALNIRYNYLNLINHQLSNQYFQKYRPNDRITEGFSSYFDHYFDIFATAFPDLEAPLGSIGSFFDIGVWPTPRVFVNPPYDEGLIRAMAEKINDDLEASEKPLEFTLLLPNWRDSRTIQELKESPWLISVKEYKKGDLPFLDPMNNTIIYPGDVVEIVLGNSKEAKEKANAAKAKPRKNKNLEIVRGTGTRVVQEPSEGSESSGEQVGCIEYLSSLDPDCLDYSECMDYNFHLSQIQYYPPEDGHLTVEPLVNLDRILRDDAPTRPYQRRESQEKTVDHWGQRKLLLSEIEFLTLHSRDNDTIVYAGAAPGTHTNYLSRLFPTLKFILYDPSPFEARETRNIEIHTGNDGFFTDKVAETFANRNDVLFISDIRTQTDEQSVKQNMDMQMNWHLIMKPRYSMLKFRLPWTPGQTEYLDGKIYLPIWGPQTTTETRLMVPRNAGMKIYDNTKYESQMYYFNSFTRTTFYARKELPGPQVPGLDHCYDCSAEICVLCKWIEKYGGSVADIASFMNANSKNSSKTGRTLAVHISAETKRQFPSRNYEREEED